MRTWTCLLILMLGVQTAFAADPVLTGVKTERSGTSFVTELSFDSPVDPKVVKFDFINETVQINVKGVQVVPKRVFTKVEDEKVRSVFTYQSDKDLLRTRVIYKKGIFSDKFKDGIKVTALGASIRVEISETPTVKAVAASEPDAVLAPKLTLNVPPRSLEASEPIAEVSKNEITPQSTEAIAAKEIEKAAEAVPVTANVATDNFVKTDKKETEIPVFVDATKAKSAEAQPVRLGPIAGGLLILLTVLGGTAYSVRTWYRGKAGKRPATAIKVVAQHHLGPKKNLAIIKVAGETILIGVTDNNVNLIKTLSLIDEDEIPDETPKHFASALKRSMKSTPTPTPTAPKSAATEEDEVEEEFSLKGLREIVKSRLQRNSDRSGDLT